MPPPFLRALIVDYGGVLTNALHESMTAWCAADNLDPGVMQVVMREWLGGGGSANPAEATNPAHALERGQLLAEEFEHVLASRLMEVGGGTVLAEGLLGRMFAGMHQSHGMLDVLRTARGHGLKTALCSNSWGMSYPRETWDQLFDAIVISGEIGLRKPEAQIYLHTAAKLGVPPEACVFVDDLTPNVRGAAAVGMVGVRHVDLDTTVAELEAIFGCPFGAPDDAETAHGLGDVRRSASAAHGGRTL